MAALLTSRDRWKDDTHVHRSIHSIHDTDWIKSSSIKHSPLIIISLILIFSSLAHQSFKLYGLRKGSNAWVDGNTTKQHFCFHMCGAVGHWRRQFTPRKATSLLLENLFKDLSLIYENIFQKKMARRRMLNWHLEMSLLLLTYPM